jgi:hypothetical protein
MRRSFSAGNPVPPTLTDPYARRWHALLAENTAIQNEHRELTSSFTQPFSPQQKVQLNANAVRRQKLSLKLHDLVDEWTADANGRASLPRALSIL